LVNLPDNEGEELRRIERWLADHKSGIGTGLPLSISMDVGAFESIKGGKTTATYPYL
jgi:hypothetical protein